MVPSVQDYARLDEMHFELNDENHWWAAYRDAKLELERRYGTSAYVTPVYCPGPLDIAFALRGPALYTDFYDHPAGLRRLLSFVTEGSIRICAAQRAIGAEYRTKRDHWAPGWGFNVMVPGFGGIITCDISCQLSPGMFGEWERPLLARIIADSPGFLIHTHAVGAQQQRAYAAMPGAEILQIVGDPNMPDPCDDIDAILDRVGMKPLLITASPAVIRRNIRRLSQGRIVLRTDVRTIGEGREVLDLVRAYTRG